MLQLIMLIALGHELFGLLAGQHEGLEGQVFLHDLLHFLLDGLQILGRELSVAQIHVIEKAVLGGGAEGEIRLGIEALDGLGHDMGRGMAQNVQLLLGRALGNLAVSVDDFHWVPPFIEIKIFILLAGLFRIKKHPWQKAKGA